MKIEFDEMGPISQMDIDLIKYLKNKLVRLKLYGEAAWMRGIASYGWVIAICQKENPKDLVRNTIEKQGPAVLLIKRMTKFLIKSFTEKSNVQTTSISTKATKVGSGQ